MSDEMKRLYEGLFLFPQSAATDLKSAVDHLGEIFSRAEAEIVSLCKWDERRLAYEIKGNKRGVYFQAFLKVAPTKLGGMERDMNLSERVLRAMLTRAEHVPQEVIEVAEGRERINDEIKLRGEQAKEAEDKTTTVTTAAAADEAAPASASDAPVGERKK